MTRDEEEFRQDPRVRMVAGANLPLDNRRRSVVLVVLYLLIFAAVVIGGTLAAALALFG